MRKSKTSQFIDPIHGLVTVIETESSLMMTNAKPRKDGMWVKQGNTYTWQLTPNRKARRHPAPTGL